MPSDPLYAPKLKIKWAHEHVEQIHRTVYPYVQSKPCVFFKQLDTQASEEVTYVRVARGVPESVVIWTSYVVHNLRSALDQLAYALAKINGASDTKLRGVYFPIAGSADDFNGAGTQRKIASLSDRAKEFIKMYKPYRGGNDTFWLLNELARADKHQTLIDLGVLGTLSSFSESSIHPVTITAPGFRSLDEDTGNLELWRHPAGTEQKPNAEFTIVVSLRNVYVGQPQEPVAATLSRMANAVEGMVTLAEVEFFS